MSAAVKPAPQENRGRFKPGPDPRRHVFTKEECSDGFWAAVTSIADRYPDAVDASGTHMSRYFLTRKTARDTIN